MVKDKERKSRVKGSTNYKERQWGSGRGKNFRPYRIGQVDWSNRLNYVRKKSGDRKVADLVGVSHTDPSYKTIRRWTTGERVPSREVYEKINKAYNRLQAKDFIPIRDAIRNTKIVKRTKDNYASKVNLFETSLRAYAYVTSKNSPGLAGEYGEYIQTVSNEGKTKAPGRRAIVLVSTYVRDTRKNIEHMEVGLIIREDSPSEELLINAIDSWCVRHVPEPNDYLTIAITGIWFSYV